MGINSLPGEKKSGKNTGREKFRRGKIWSLAKNLVTLPRLFFPDKVLTGRWYLHNSFYDLMLHLQKQPPEVSLKIPRKINCTVVSF